MTQHRRGKKLILRRFHLSEISGVDKPAQVHALATIMKRDTRQTQQENTMPDNFSAAVSQIRKADAGISALAAMRKARDEFPDLYDAHQSAAEDAQDAAIAKANEPYVESTATVDFMRAVTAEMREAGCSRTVAMTAIRKREPELYSAYAEF